MNIQPVDTQPGCLPLAPLFSEARKGAGLIQLFSAFFLACLAFWRFPGFLMRLPRVAGGGAAGVEYGGLRRVNHMRMGMSLLVLRRRIAGLLLLSVLLAACGGRGSGPVLIAESTYVIPTVAVLPSITPTRTPSPTDLPTLLPFTPDTPAAEVILITPTLAPSRTPTQTYTPSNTPTLTYTPSPTRPPTQTPFPTPTPFVPAFVPTQAPLGGAIPAGGSAVTAPRNPDGSCAFGWFVTARPPSGCPVTAPMSSAAASLAFERGMMFWFGVDGMITVLYTDGQQPAWERYVDTWREGMPERDLTISGPEGLWQQPRRGFGQLWRTTATVRSRLGWALHEWEDSYTGTLQSAGSDSGGAIYLTNVDGRIYALTGDRTHWESFTP